MELLFVGDIHLGYKRKSFTSSIAKGRYEEQLLNHGLKALGLGVSTKIQVGDVFDRYNNSDSVLINGIDLCYLADLVVAGNHDISNTLEDNSTLKMVDEVINKSVDFIFPDKQEETPTPYRVYGDTAVAVIPYCYTQEQFELEIQKAYDLEIPEKVTYKLLVMHTNYNLSYELTDTTNNLTKDDAEALLEKYDYIISGHEHNYNSYFKGRLIMTGSVFPLSTAELEDKYVHTFNSETGKFTRECIWSAEKHSVSYDVTKLPDELPEDTQFVTITGRAKAADVVESQKVIASWWSKSTGLLVCKPTYEVITNQNKSVKIMKADMVSNIRGLLKKPAQKLLDNIVKEIEDES